MKIPETENIKWEEEMKFDSKHPPEEMSAVVITLLKTIYAGKYFLQIFTNYKTIWRKIL